MSGLIEKSRRRFAGVMSVATLCAAVALVAASTALADPYWFYQGNLPTSSGARTVLLGSNPATPIYQRMSWSSCSHNMTFIQVTTGGSWDGATAYYSNGCDQEIMVQYPDQHNNYGCQNPSGESTVYVNCRAGTNP